MAKSRVIRSSRATEKRRKKMITRLVVLCLCSVALVIGLSFGSHASFLVFSQVEIDSDGTVPVSAVEALVTKATEGSYINLFSKKNIWIYPKQKILEEITKNFPQVAGVYLSSMDNVLAVHITSREPVALWCEEVESAQCYFVDKDGFIYGKAPEFTGSVYTIFTGNVENEDPIGTSYLGSSDFIKLDGFLKLLKNLGMTPQKVHLSAGGDGQVFLASGGKILFTFGPDIAKTGENLAAFLSEVKLVNGKGGINAQYIDARFGNKIFYK